jgi:hypothetical protein
VDLGIDFWNGSSHAHYDVHPTDGRLLMLKMFEGKRIRVVDNWFPELKALW